MPTTADSTGPVVDTARLRLMERAVETWKGQLVDVGGRNTLLYYKDLRQGTLDLRMHGASDATVQRLLGSHTVRLSDVFREPPGEPGPEIKGTPLTAAAKRARTVRAKAVENFEERGIETLFLAWGMATWTNHIGTATPAAPVLLREASLIPRGTAAEDFEIVLSGDFEVNPTLMHFLALEFRVELGEDELLDLLHEDVHGTPDATPVFERLGKLARDVPAFAVHDRVVLGNFSYAKLPMVKDLELALASGQLATNDLLAAIAGDPRAAEAVRERHPAVTVEDADRTPPSDEFLVLDADASQSFAINTAVHGRDVVVEGPPGTGKSQTIANLIATLAAQGKRTLFVAEKRAAIDAVLERLVAAGLGHLVFDLHDRVTSRKRVAQELAASLSAAETIPLTDHSVSHSRLERRREALRAWRQALHEQRHPWNLSVHDIQAELIALRRTEAITARFDRDVISHLGDDAYRAAADDLEDFAELGGLTLLVGGSPWRQAFDNSLVTSAEQVSAAHDLISRLADRGLPRAKAQLDRIAAACGLRKPDAISEWAELLRLIETVETTLHRYDVQLFNEAGALADDLAPARRSTLGRGAASVGHRRYRRARKRMIQLAGGRKDSSREMRAAAEAAAEQKRRWDERALDGGLPRTPDDLDAALGLLAQLDAELRALVDRTADTDLPRSGLSELGDKLEALLRDQSTLVKLPELHRLALSLSNRGVWAVVAEAAARGLEPESAVRALRFVWLESILAHVTSSDPIIGGFEREAHDRVVGDFRDADVNHLRRTPDRVRRAVAERLVRARDEHPVQSQLIRAEASKKQRHLPLRQLVQQAPDVLTALKPCWAMSPLVVAQMLPPEPLFDIVVFDEASQVMPADAVGALLRARTAVVAGDSKQLPPTNFFAATFGGGVDDEVAEAEMEAAFESGVSLTQDMESVLEVMRALLPPPHGTRPLQWHYRSRDERLIAFSNAQESLYDWSLTTFPGTGVDDCIRHELIPWKPGRVGQDDSVSDEVERVVELIVEHAEQRPDESLGVIAMGIKHAHRIEERLRQVRLSRPDVDRLLELGPAGRQRPEPLFVKNLERVQGDERDAVILTIGYGKSADGRMMYRFGPLNHDGGERRLNVAITRARSRIAIVSSFSSSDLDPNKLRSEGARMLCRYLQYAESGGHHLGDQAMPKPPLNPFERDVRDALTAAGVPLVAQYGCSGYWIDFAAQHPSQPGRMVLAIEADGATYHAGQTARDRDRLRQEHLERLGWHFHRIWSTDWFRHRDAETERAVAAWLAAVRAADARPRPLRAPGRPPPVVTERVSERVSEREPDREAGAGVPRRTRPRPDLFKYQPIGAYSQATLRSLVDHIEADTLLRTEEQLIEVMMSELGMKRRGKNIVAALRKAIRDARAGRSDNGGSGPY